MIMNSSSLYKTLSDNDFLKLNLKVKRNYFYFVANEQKEIIEKAFQNTNKKNIYELLDDNYEWNPKEQSLFLNIHISMSNLSDLFGRLGFCYEDAFIGIGLVWKPQKSKIKRCQKIGEFSIKENNIDLEATNIELSNLSSNVEFNLIMYISKPGIENGQLFFANEEGMILYQKLLWSIIVEGHDSVFPIYEFEDKNGPIWSYFCDVDYIGDDEFDMGHIKININKLHPAYSLFHYKSPKYCEEYVNEILSSAIAMIIIDIRSTQDNNLIDFNEPCEKNSILYVFNYFKDKLGFKINDDYNSLLASIKTFFDRGMK